MARLIVNAILAGADQHASLTVSMEMYQLMARVIVSRVIMVPRATSSAPATALFAQEKVNVIVGSMDGEGITANGKAARV